MVDLWLLTTSSSKLLMENQRITGTGLGEAEGGRSTSVSAEDKHLKNQGPLKEAQSLNHIFILILLSLPEVGPISCCGRHANSKARSARTRVGKARSIC